MRPIPVFILVFLLADIALARADWLEDAWSGKSTAQRGSPAITVHPGGLSVVLPAETLDEAFSERGMTRPDALRAFLDRYSPQCSTVLDLNTAQPNLTVELRIQAAMSLDDLPANSLDEMFAAMETVKIAPSTGTESTDAGSKGTGKDGHTQIPRIAQAFTTLPERFDFSIDYAPDRIAHCVAPQDPIS
jgi:hypothetical protein